MHTQVISTPPTLTELRATAVRTLNEHVNHAGLCAICQAPGRVSASVSPTPTRPPDEPAVLSLLDRRARRRHGLPTTRPQ